MEKEKYAIVWQDCRKEDYIAQRFYVPGFKGYLPFFLSGTKLTTFENKEAIELNEENLLKGILIGLYKIDHDPQPWHQKEDRETLLYLLDVLGKGFHFESPEMVILNVSASIREENGNSASRIVLEVGADLLPQSSKIKSDLIADLWAILAESGSDVVLLKEVAAIIPEINLNDIHPNMKEIVCYYGLCSLVLLKDEQGVKKYLPQYFYPNVTLKFLKEKIQALLENPEGFAPADLEISSR